MRPVERALLAAGVSGLLSIGVARSGDPFTIMINGAIAMVLAFTLSSGLLRQKRVQAWAEARQWTVVVGVCVFVLGLLYVVMWAAMLGMPAEGTP